MFTQIPQRSSRKGPDDDNNDNNFDDSVPYQAYATGDNAFAFRVDSPTLTQDLVGT